MACTPDFFVFRKYPGSRRQRPVYSDLEEVPGGASLQSSGPFACRRTVQQRDPVGKRTASWARSFRFLGVLDGARVAGDQTVTSALDAPRTGMNALEWCA